MSLFDRTADLIIYEKGKRLLGIPNLRIRFVVKKTNTASSNTAIITVTNLSESTRNKIGTTGTSVALRAGYEQAKDLIAGVCIMDVIDVRTIRQPPDVSTILTCADGANSARTIKKSLSFDAGATVKQVYKALFADTDIVLRGLADVEDKVYHNGFSESGSLADLLQKLADKTGYLWSFQNREVQLAKLGEPTTASIIHLTKDSGLIGSPQRHNKLGQPQTPGQKDGWIVKSLLMPVIEPGDILWVTSEEVDAQFRVVELTHVGDTRGQEFFTTMDVEEYAN